MGAPIGQKRKSYSAEEIQFIIDNAETMFFANIGKILGRSKASIKNVVRRLNLSTPTIKNRLGNRVPKKQDMAVDNKLCTKCRENKPFSEFNKAKYGNFGLRSVCKSCQAKEAMEYGLKNKNKIKERGKKYRIEKAEQISVQRAIRTAKNKEKLYTYAKEYRKNNPGKVNAKTAKRRQAKRKRTPPWLTKEHWEQIGAFYIEAARLTKETGIPHEVDHIIPIMGKNVSGLHVPWNLQILTRSDNRKKSRKLIT